MFGKLQIVFARLVLVLAVLLQVETIAHAGMGIRHAVEGPNTVEVCTTEGIKRIAVDASGVAPASGVHHAEAGVQDHCAACASLGAWAGMPSFPGALGVSPAGPSFFPAFLPRRTATGQADHAARAPPALR